MRKRFISDITWKSKKVREIQPPEWRPEYAWLIPMVEDNGVFEFDPESIYADAYAVARPGWTKEKVQELLEEFIRVKLIYRWSDEVGKVWGFMVGSDKPGLLPKPSERYSKLPLPDPAGLQRFLGGQPAGEPREIASGLGLGSGIGSGLSSTGQGDTKAKATAAGRGKAFNVED